MQGLWLLILGALLVFFIMSYPSPSVTLPAPTSNRPYQRAFEQALAKTQNTKSFENQPEIEPEGWSKAPSSSNGVLVYDQDHPGPSLGREMGVPVPQGTLSDYSVARNRNWISSREPAFRTAYPGYASGFPGSALNAPPPIKGPYDFPLVNRPLASNDFFKPFGPNVPPQFPSFVGNVSAFAPVPEVITPWEKVGLLISKHDGPDPQLLNLYRRPIAPLQDLWEYNVQDLNGFIIRLDQRRFLEDGDIISHIPGKPGEWKVNMPADNKYVWV